MQLSRLRQGDPTVAIGTELDVIAAVVIGGGSLSGGEGSIFGSVVGALIMAFLRNGCQQMGWPNYIQEIIIGGIIVLAGALGPVGAGGGPGSSEAGSGTPDNPGRIGPPPPPASMFPASPPPVR